MSRKISFYLIKLAWPLIVCLTLLGVFRLHSLENYIYIYWVGISLFAYLVAAYYLDKAKNKGVWKNIDFDRRPILIATILIFSIIGLNETYQYLLLQGKTESIDAPIIREGTAISPNGKYRYVVYSYTYKSRYFEKEEMSDKENYERGVIKLRVSTFDPTVSEMVAQ